MLQFICCRTQKENLHSSYFQFQSSGDVCGHIYVCLGWISCSCARALVRLRHWNHSVSVGQSVVCSFSSSLVETRVIFFISIEKQNNEMYFFCNIMPLCSLRWQKLYFYSSSSYRNTPGSVIMNCLLIWWEGIIIITNVLNPIMTLLTAAQLH